MFEIIKTVGSLATTISTASVAKTVLEVFKPAELSKLQKVVWFIGSAGIGAAVADAATQSFEKSVDDVVDTFKGVKEIQTKSEGSIE